MTPCHFHTELLLHLHSRASFKLNASDCAMHRVSPEYVCYDMQGRGMRWVNSPWEVTAMSRLRDQGTVIYSITPSPHFLENTLAEGEQQEGRREGGECG